jgi:hypothetical protein
VDTANTLDTNYGYANALLGNFTTYTETDGFADVKGKSAQRRVLWPGHLESQPVADGRLWHAVPLVPPVGVYRGRHPLRVLGSRSLHPGGSPLLYVPVRVNNQNFAQNPVTGELRCRCMSDRSCRTRVTRTTAW